MLEIPGFKPIGLQIPVLRLFPYVDRICMYGGYGSGRTELLVQLAARHTISAYVTKANTYYLIQRFRDQFGTLYNEAQQYIDIPGGKRIWLFNDRFDPAHLNDFSFSFIAVDNIEPFSETTLKLFFRRQNSNYGKIVVTGYMGDHLEFLAKQHFSFVGGREG